MNDLGILVIVLFALVFFMFLVFCTANEYILLRKRIKNKRVGDSND